MTSALVGHTGFVGSNLLRQVRFDALFNSKNIEQIAGQAFGLLVISGMPAAKWMANADPAADRATLERLWAAVRQARAETVIVISTIDVYPSPIDVNEGTPIDPAAQQPYGKHRLMLEQLAAAHFPRVLCVRLPGLFGPGLKKNAIHDLLHNHEVHKVHANGAFQFYNLARLWADVQTALKAGLSVVNFATEPVSIREVAREAFGLDFTNDPGTKPARYDVRTKHASLFGGHGGYLDPREEVLAELRCSSPP
ncbi:MAG TPA: NAD-dependent epimerase/dehydratase family protein, partial [Gemmataceae bacterium]|nr:NAD-dependent epimerase/dehydratase family protein [Gemmataceae bacterium]